MTNARHPAIFVHITKNGGTTLVKMFVYLFGHTGIASVYRFPNDTPANTDYLRGLFESRALSNRQVVVGHYAFMAEYAAEYPHFTLLRDPIERQISWYFYVRRDPNQTLNPLLYTDGMTLERGIRLLGDNEQVRYLINVFDRPLTEADLEQAKFNLEHRFAAFGILERYDESLILFKRAFDWPMPYYAIENKGVNRPKAISDEARRVAAEHNTLDIALYEWACELFAQRIAAQPPEFAATLHRFERNLTRWQRWIAPVWQRYDRFYENRLRVNPIYRLWQRARGKLRIMLQRST